MAAIITLDSLKKILKKFQEIIFKKYDDKITEIEQKNTDQDTNLRSEITRATGKENELSGRCDSYDLHIENIENSVSANTSTINILNSDSTVDGSVDNKIKNALSDITKLQFNVVEELPTTGESEVIYFVLNSTISEGKNYYDEYAWINDKFELLGQAIANVDLSDYYTKAETEALIPVIDEELSSTSTNPVQNKVVDNALQTLENDIANTTDSLQTQIDSKAPKTGSSSDFQSNTHYYKSLGGFSDFDCVVVPILDISPSTTAERYSSGKLFTHRNNGLFPDPLVEWKCNKSYNPTASEKYSLTVYKKSDYWKFCTFTYNNVKYLGVVFNYTTASVSSVYFDGYTSSMTSPLFTIIKYNDTQDGVTNTEIYNSLTVLETEEYYALSSETEKKRKKQWYGSHSNYIKLGSIPVSSGSLYFVNLDIDIISANGDASFPTGKINANISSGNYSTGFNINGYSTIDISNTSSTLYPRLIVEKTSTDYNVYIYCSYNYIGIKVSDEYNNGWEAAPFTESTSLSGTTVYNSATSKAIININDLQRKDSAVTFENKNGHNGLGANGNYTSWIRTPVSGIIPYDAGSNTNSSKLGTPNWKFAEANALTVNADTVNADTVNAETLNGNAATASSWAYSELDLTSQSTDNFYPVIIETGNYGFADVEIASQSLSGTAAYNQNRIKFTLSANGWSDVPKSLFVSEYACYTETEITIGCIGYGNESFTNGVIWLRGGVKYFCRTNNTSLTLKTESYTQGTTTVTVGTNYYGGTNTKVTILFTPQTTIESGLYTNRTITAPTFKGSLSGNASTATKATQDASGNVITSTYATKAQLTNTALSTGSISIPTSSSYRYVFLGWYDPTLYEDISFYIYGKINTFINAKGSTDSDLVVSFEQNPIHLNYPYPKNLQVAEDSDGKLGFWVFIPATTIADTWNVRAELKGPLVTKKIPVTPTITTTNPSDDYTSYVISVSDFPRGQDGSGCTAVCTDFSVQEQFRVTRGARLSGFVEFSSCDDEASFNGSVKVFKKMVIPTTAPSTTELEPGCIWIS